MKDVTVKGMKPDKSTKDVRVADFINIVEKYHDPDFGTYDYNGIAFEVINLVKNVARKNHRNPQKNIS